MKAFIITLASDPSSIEAAGKCKDSSEEVGNDFHIDTFWASTPETVRSDMRRLGISEWSYPEEGTKEWGNMVLSAYKSSNPDARKACFCSHALLWELCREQGEPILILEHDALWTAPLKVKSLLAAGKWGAVGINDPRGATRRARAYHVGVRNAPVRDVVEVPWVDNDTVPQGMAGASAYVIRPWAAALALRFARDYGAWPNDALLCKQNFGWLGQLKPYCTTIQKMKSTLA